MESELAKIDILRSLFRISYDDARKALESTSGDVVDALALIERSHASRKDLLALGSEVAHEVQKMVSGGSIKRLRFRYGNKLIAETPVALTAAAAIAVGVAAVLVSKLVIEVEKGEEGAAT